MSEALSLVQIENPLTQPDWNARLVPHSNSTFFHTREWASVLHHTYGFAPMYFITTAGQQFLSLLPVMEVNSWLTGRRGVSLPFTDSCEPLNDFGKSEAPFEEVLRHGYARKWKYLETRGGPVWGKLAIGPRPSMTFFAHELRLQSNLAQLFQNLASPTRSALRKAEKSGLTVTLSTDLSAMRDYYSLHCQTRRQHGLPPQPFLFFYQIQTQVMAQNMGVIISAKQGAQTVAAGIFFLFGGGAIYKFGASDRAFQNLRANNLIFWEAIKWCVQQGARCLHFGRTSLHNTGLRRFKQGWGAEEKRLDYYKYDLRKKTFISDRDDTAGWHTRVFQHLPVFLSRWLGAALYKHIA